MYQGFAVGCWEEQGDSGTYSYDEGDAGRFCIAWNVDGLVALAITGDSEFAEFHLDPNERDPLARLPGLPDELREVAEHAADKLDRLGSAGMWSLGAQAATMSRPMATDWADGIELLAGFGMTPTVAMRGDKLTMPWEQWFDLSPFHCELARSWVEAVDQEGSARVPHADEEVLLEPPREFTLMNVERAEAAAGQLARAGIEWEVPVAEIERQLAAGAALDE
jgi:hypothetical protein